MATQKKRRESFPKGGGAHIALGGLQFSPGGQNCTKTALFTALQTLVRVL